MPIFNFLKKIFSNRSKSAKAYIYFELDTNDNINISLDYNINELDIGPKIGKLLYSLNKGFLMKPIIDQLNQSIDKDTSHAKVIADILESWNSCYLIDQFNEPVVKPIGAFAKNVK